MIWFGALGAAGITPRALVVPCWDEPRAAIRCVAARDRRRAEGFAQWFRIPVVHDGYADVVTDASIDAVYNALPISGHREWTLQALAAGKHVLCEKSLACNAREAEAMAQAAEDAGLVLMEASHYRYHPVFMRAKEIVDSGVLGRIEEVEATFNAPVTDPEDIRNQYATGGGATMDLGCYPISWVNSRTVFIAWHRSSYGQMRICSPNAHACQSIFDHANLLVYAGQAAPSEQQCIELARLRPNLGWT